MEAGTTFVNRSSIIRWIWGSTDVTLFIFAGAAAEFAVDKEVDWLYFTGKLPADPIGRLFSTVRYAQDIIFSDTAAALQSIDRINHIHQSLESKRQRSISAVGYKHVLYMLIYYSVASFELLERKLSDREKENVLQVFRDVGAQMHIPDIPPDYRSWQAEYGSILDSGLRYSLFSKDLFRQYRKHLGGLRYMLLLEVQRMLVPPRVGNLLGLGQKSFGPLMISIYKLVKKLNMHRQLIRLLVPDRFRYQLRQWPGEPAQTD